jgi:hypothetical protein
MHALCFAIRHETGLAYEGLRFVPNTCSGRQQENGACQVYVAIKEDRHSQIIVIHQSKA